MKHWKRVITTFMVISVAVVGLTLSGGCGSGTSSDSESTQIVTVTRGTLMTSISSFGSVSMPTQAELTFGSGGRVIELNVKEGDTVEGGQGLAKLDSASLASLQKAVTQAGINVQDAEEALETARNPYTEADIAQAKISLRNAEDALEKARNPYTEADIAQARIDLRDAGDALEKARNPYTASEITEAESTVVELRLALLDAQVEASDDISDAEDALQQAEKNYLGIIGRASGSPEYEELVDAWDRAQLTYEAAMLDAVQAVSEAEEELAEAEETLAEMMGDDALGYSADRQNQIAVAEANLVEAQEALAEMLAAAAQDYSEERQNQIAVAEDNLAEAEEALAEILAGADPAEVELRELDVTAAQAALQDARDKLEAVNMVAPFDGVVVAVNAGVGDEVTASKVIIHLVDPSVVEVDAAVDEIDVVQVTPGLMAMITVDGLPNARLRGQVTAVSLLASSQSGVVTYPITVEITNPAGVGLRDGMSATIEIVSLQAENVLLVPSSAVRRTASGTVVEVETGDGETEERVVEIGVSNGMQTEIVSGLEEGDQVVVHSTEAVSVPTQQFPGWQDRGTRIPGMDGGGGGFRPPM